MRHDGSSRSQQGREGISSVFEGGFRSMGAADVRAHACTHEPQWKLLESRGN